MPKRNLLTTSISLSAILALVLVCLVTTARTPASYAAAQQYSLVGKWGSRGSGEGKFSQPLDIVIDSSGNVYVTDFTGVANQIQKFTTNGTFITSWGHLGFGNGQFTNPAGIAIDSSGNVYVGDFGNSQNGVQKFTTNGTFITSWGSTGLGEGQFINPAGIAIDSSGN